MSEEQSPYHAHSRGLGGLLEADDGLQPLSNSNNLIHKSPTDIDNQVTCLPRDARNELTGPIMFQKVGVVAPRVQGTDDVVDTPNGRLRLPSSDATPSDVGGVHLPTDPRDRAATEDSTPTASTYPVNNPTPSIHNPIPEGAVPPPVDTRVPSVPPLRRVRARGVFIIGNGAPIKIDEGLEVHLRDGIDGQVDFII